MSFTESLVQAKMTSLWEAYSSKKEDGLAWSGAIPWGFQLTA